MRISAPTPCVSPDAHARLEARFLLGHTALPERDEDATLQFLFSMATVDDYLAKHAVRQLFEVLPSPRHSHALSHLA